MGYMIQCIKNKSPIKSIKDDSQLKKIHGQYNNLSLFNTNEGDIIIRDAQDILIPKNYRQNIIDELHSTHLADISMINLAKGKAYWPTFKEDLRSTYKSCEVSLENAISKPDPHHEVIPSSLELLQPNEVVHIDYMGIGKVNIFILKCKSSGWTWARITKDKTAETTCQVFHKYITSYDRPRSVISDAGSEFLTMFNDFLTSHYIDHRYSSYYRAQSNSRAERSVRSNKEGDKARRSDENKSKEAARNCKEEGEGFCGHI